VLARQASAVGLDIGVDSLHGRHRATGGRTRKRSHGTESDHPG
jgi:hypothetical protein